MLAAAALEVSCVLLISSRIVIDSAVKESIKIANMSVTMKA